MDSDSTLTQDRASATLASPMDSTPGLIVPQAWLDYIRVYRRGRSKPDILACMVLAWYVADGSDDRAKIAKALGSTPESILTAIDTLVSYRLLDRTEDATGLQHTLNDAEIAMISSGQLTTGCPSLTCAHARLTGYSSIPVSSPSTQREVPSLETDQPTTSSSPVRVKDSSGLQSPCLEQRVRKGKLWTVPEPPLGKCIAHLLQLNGQRGKQNIFITELLYSMFAGELTGHERVISRVARMRTELERLEPHQMPALLVTSLFHAREQEKFYPEGSISYLNALPGRVLSYIQSHINRRKREAAGNIATTEELLG